jgi:uncharacterized protein involved in response to NO
MRNASSNEIMSLPIFPTPIQVVSTSAPGPAATGVPLFRLGFRPFYLLAASYAALAVPLWVAVASGVLNWPAHLQPMLWHAHEMLFGFACAVIVGFLLTAGKAWTGLSTLRGVPLAALCVLWLLARMAALANAYVVYAALDVLLLPVVAGVLGRVLLRAGNKRNLPLLGLLVLLTAANATFHAAVLAWIQVPPLRALHAGLALVVMIECVMAGRVVPAFTEGATPGLRLRVPPLVSQLALGATALGLCLWVLFPASAVGAVALALASVAHLALQWKWQPWLTRTRPILWVLHAAYAWIAVGLLLLALAQLGIVSVSAGVHALAVGATGGLIIGMVTRTARGHTGRPLKASRAEVTAYVLVLAAAAMRVLLPMVVSPPVAWALAAAAWSLAFLIYLVVFAPWLARARADGKDG